MNANLLNAVRSLASSQGAAVLLDIRRVDENLPVFAGKEPANERKALIQCLAAGLPGELQRCPDQRARSMSKKQAAQKLAGQGFAAPLVQEIVDLVDSLIPAAAVFTPQIQTPPPQSYRRPPSQPLPQPANPPPIPRAGPGASVPGGGIPGGLIKSLSRKTLAFGVAGGIGGIAGELLSEPVRLMLEKSPPSFMGNVLDVAIWAALISLGVSIGLLMAQNIYLKKKPPSASFVRTVVLGILSGTLAGALAQVLFSFTQNISTLTEIISRIICWGLMACGVGLGVSLFVPNYPRRRAMLAGLLGGVIGGAIFRATFGLLPVVAGRIFGTAVLGVFIGLTISIVEEILREAWITVDWGRNETTSVSLGAKPVVLGSSPEADIYLPRNKFPPAAAIIKIENSKVIIDNKLTGQYTEAADGGEIYLGTVKLIIHVKKDKG
jgi:hypothetical protein